MSRKRRCPQHPWGCSKHPNTSKPRTRRRPASVRKGSIETHVQVRTLQGDLLRIAREVWGAGR